jgi:hypothetical protein
MAFPLRRALRPIALALMALLVAAAGARAEAPYSFAATPGKLPKTAVPLHYAIELAPDIEKLTLAGSEVVDIEVTAPTDRLMLNAVNMTVTSAAIEGDVGPAASIGVDARAETVTFVFPRIIPVGPTSARRLRGEYQPVRRDLFIVDYPSDDDAKAHDFRPARTLERAASSPGTSLLEPASSCGDCRTSCSPSPTCRSCARNRPAPGSAGGVRCDARMSSYLFVLAAGSSSLAGMTVSQTACHLREGLGAALGWRWPAQILQRHFG